MTRVRITNTIVQKRRKYTGNTFGLLVTVFNQGIVARLSKKDELTNDEEGTTDEGLP